MLAALAGAASSAHAQFFTPGDLVVSTYGVGGGFLDGVSTPITLMEFTTSGTFVRSLTLPTTDSGANFGIVGEYGSSSEANLQLSGDGHSLLIAGYQADAANAGIGGNAALAYSDANGTALAQSFSISNGSNIIVPRVAAVISANGSVNTSTIFKNLYDQNNARSVWSQNGTTLYVSGQGSGLTDQGIFKITAGSNNVANGTPAPTPISANTGLSTRIVTTFDGNMYYSTDVKNVATGIFEYSGIPNSAASAVAVTPANNGLSGSSLVTYSPAGFFFANDTTLYVADTGAPKNKATGNGGIQKWTFNGSAWVLDYTLLPSSFVHNYNDKTSSLTDGEVGFGSITGLVIGGNVELFAVSYTIGDADTDGLYAVNDTLSALTNPGDNFTLLQTGPGVGNVAGNLTAGGIVFKSVSFAPSAIPEPSTYALLLGAATLGFCCWRRRTPAAA
ncbi:MAG TPA: PEP-CTERM sorting domain-containing protein [Opitutales bacterium]|nr:PEP-CTERM sorting domain-containing protein [Opitutales bacterium]